MDSAFAFYETWLINNRYSLNEVGDIIGHRYFGKPDRLSEVVWTDYILARAAMGQSAQKFRIVSLEEFRIAVRDHKVMHTEKSFKAMTDILKGNGFEDLSELSKYLQALTGRVDQTELGVMAHFLSSVKRKMLGLPVVHHIMPIISGPQGTGKSIALNQLFQPLGNWYALTSLDRLLDRMSHGFIEAKIVALCDEMAGLQRSDTKDLKSLITSTTITGRKAYDKDVTTIINRCSFIGTTNESAAILLKDTTGARRFFEIKIEKPTDRAALGLAGVTIGTIDYEKLWQGVATTEFKYWTPELEASLKTHQEGLTASEPVIDFIDEHELKPNGNGEVIVDRDSLFRLFRDWTKEGNYAADFTSRNLFCRRMGLAGIPIERCILREGDITKKYTFFRLNKASTYVALMEELKVAQRIRTSAQFVKGGAK